MPCGGEGSYAHLLRSSVSSHTRILSYSMRRSWVRMDEKRAGHSPAENAAHSHLGSSHSRRDRSKEELEVSSVVSLVESFFTRVERVFDVHDLDVSMHSQIIQGIQRPEVLHFGLSIPPTLRRLIQTASFISRSWSIHKALTLILVLLHRDLSYHCMIWSDSSLPSLSTTTSWSMYDTICYKYDYPW